MRPYLNNVSGKSVSDVITLQGGINTCYDKTFIEDNQMPYMWNMALLEPPTLSIRNSRVSMAWYLEDTTTFAMGETLALFASSSKILYQIMDMRTDENPDADAYVYRYITSGGGFMKKEFVGSVIYSSRYYICECVDAQNKYIIIGTMGKKYIYTEGSEMVDSKDLNYGILECHKNRLFVANGTSLKFSRKREYDNFEINDDDVENTAGELNITNAKGKIVAIKPYDGKLIIFCERSWHILYGNSPNPKVDQFTLVDMDDGIGCVSDKTVNICDRRLYWMDTDATIYQYNGSYINRVSEPYGNDNYASYGGIKGIGIHMASLHDVRMASYDSKLYVIVRRDPLLGALNDTALVYDTRTRVWWVEDGAFAEICRLDVDTRTSAYSRSDFLIGAMYNGDLVIMNTEPIGKDLLFNLETRECDYIDINYGLETKTWLLGSVKHKKTLTNVWFQADADAKVYVSDHWTDILPWGAVPDNDYIKIGELKSASSHSMEHPTQYFHEGEERQRMIIPRMYMQRVNALAIRVEGKGNARFYLLEKEWRIK